jgi:hypothetical protein
VNLKLAVFECVSAERRHSDVFNLNLDEHTMTIEGGDAHRIGTTPDRNSTIFIASLAIESLDRPSPPSTILYLFAPHVSEQDKLLEVQECTYMRNFLPDLDKSLPSVLCGQL